MRIAAMLIAVSLVVSSLPAKCQDNSAERPFTKLNSIFMTAAMPPKAAGTIRCSSMAVEKGGSVWETRCLTLRTSSSLELEGHSIPR